MVLSIYTTLPPRKPKIIYFDFPETARRYRAFKDLIECDTNKNEEEPTTIEMPPLE